MNGILIPNDPRTYGQILAATNANSTTLVDALCYLMARNAGHIDWKHVKEFCAGYGKSDAERAAKFLTGYDYVVKTDIPPSRQGFQASRKPIAQRGVSMTYSLTPTGWLRAKTFQRELVMLGFQEVEFTEF